ncbi:hypothetical protein [Afifella sp. IM 167]|uniref:hypothetical protein n=1 Tax=Afifella sp. IM 167 TaxID=2033586 RepID=UPI001CCAD2F9|nr:hypothetical protein [Afifella sp. IM 167]MBZ8133245.1 hypothetical protein [Afifella sp. IM 167]
MKSLPLWVRWLPATIICAAIVVGVARLFTMPPPDLPPASGESPASALDYWAARYQGLAGGVMTLCAALIAGSYVIRQMRQSNRHHREMLDTAWKGREDEWRKTDGSLRSFARGFERLAGERIAVIESNGELPDARALQAITFPFQDISTTIDLRVVGCSGSAAAAAKDLADSISAFNKQCRRLEGFRHSGVQPDSNKFREELRTLQNFARNIGYDAKRVIEMADYARPTPPPGTEPG